MNKRKLMKILADLNEQIVVEVSKHREVTKEIDQMIERREKIVATLEVMDELK